MVTDVPIEQKKRVTIHHNNTKFESYDGPARAFPIWPHSKKYFTCAPNRSNPIGNLFVGPPKAASSTVGGIMLRISRNVHNRIHHNNDLGRMSASCKIKEHHYMYPAVKRNFRERNPKKSFMWSFLREPTSRFVSEFFHFQVSRKKVEPTDEAFQEYCRKYSYANYIQVLHPEPGNQLVNKSAAVAHIIQEYDFIGITERMDESLVVLKLLLGLEMNDILYLKSAKGKGGFDDGGFENTCVYIMPSFVSPGMRDFFDNNRTWKLLIKGDNMVYQAAYKSLDLTIDALGRDLVAQELEKFHQAMKVAQKTCTNVTYPCSPGGVKYHAPNNDCLFSDLACGYKCLESLVL